MQTWHLAPQPAGRPIEPEAVGLLLQAPESAQPAASLLAFLNRLAPVDYLSLVAYRLGERETLAAPDLVEGHARPGLANVTPDCFHRYRQAWWREDAGTRLAHQADRRGGGIAAMHVHAEDIHVDSWRSDIYERAHLSARLSFYYEPVDGATYAINLYRDRGHGAFGAADIDAFLGVAPLLRQAHRVALRSRPDASAIGRDARVAAAEAALLRKVPELSPRERAVCARIACGISADGIAADLAVAASTVATLRKRAYAKLADRGVFGGRLQLAAFLH